MKRFFLIIALLSFLGIKESSAQWVIEAPVLEGLVTQIGTINNYLLASQQAITRAQELKEKMKTATDWLTRLESIQEFIDLMTTTVCMTKDLIQYLDLAIHYGLLDNGYNCLFTFNYRVNISRLRSVQEVFTILLSPIHSVDAGQRLITLRNATQDYKEAMVDLYALQLQLKQVVDNYLKTKDRDSRIKTDYAKIYNINF